MHPKNGIHITIKRRKYAESHDYKPEEEKKMERFICHNIFGDVVCTYTVLWRWYSAHANISRFGMKLCYALKRWNECKNAKDERQRLVNTYDCSAADEKTLHSPMQEYTCIHLTTIYIHITHYYDLHHGCYITRRREISVQTFMEKLFVNILHEKVRNMTRSKRENTIIFFFLVSFYASACCILLPSLLLLFVLMFNHLLFVLSNWQFKWYEKNKYIVIFIR